MKKEVIYTGLPKGNIVWLSSIKDGIETHITASNRDRTQYNLYSVLFIGEKIIKGKRCDEYSIEKIIKKAKTPETFNDEIKKEQSRGQKNV